MSQPHLKPRPSPRSQPLLEWTRLPEERKIAGVCAGIAEQMGVPVTIVRAAFVVTALPMFSGIGILAYLVLWFLMAPADGERSGLDRVVEAVESLTDSDPQDDEEYERREP